MSRDLLDLVRELNTLNDDNLADRVIENSDVQWCLSELQDILEEMPTLTPPNEWVSVEERFPEPEFDGQQRGFYLVALSNGVVKELAYEFRHYENMIFDVGWHETAHPVTHWMSLPEPPAKES